MTKPTTSPFAGRLTRRVALIAAAAGLAATLVPEQAHAGLYTAVQCHPGFAAGREDARFTRSSADYVPAARCEHGAGGLQVTHRRSHTLAGRSGGWSLASPAGTRLIRVAARVSGAAAGGIVPEALVRTGAALRSAGRVPGTPHRLSWRGDGGSLVARLRCTRTRSCAPSDDARLRMNRIRLRISDATEPSIALTGSLANDVVVRGTRELGALAGDLGGGVRGVSVEVNGHPAGQRLFPCALSGAIALRLVPCPASASASLPEDTAAGPFRQGANDVRVCASDYAARGANVACATRRIRVDNDCPISGVTGGSRLAASIEGVRHGFVARPGEHPRVAGRLLDGSGSPVSGARVCVAARTPMPGAREHVIATPLTDGAGRFSARIPAGPSRHIRIAYWPGQAGAIERFTKIRFRARPRLELRPHRRLRRGDRMRYIARIAGPAAGRRIVKIEARADGRWVPVASGRTGARGVYRTSYRFHATTRRRVYRFRALVPRQHGYPYAPGVSAVKRVVVRG